MKICRRCIVKGRVQGVCFRVSTQRKAQSLGLTGWARNCADSTVEVLAYGEQTNVDALHEWLWQGPRYAEVTAVDCADHQFPDCTAFEIG